jgi:hypothetical protein
MRLSRRQFFALIAGSMVLPAIPRLTASISPTTTHCAAVASVPIRAWCAADAPLVLRVEAGTRLQRLDEIIDPHSGTWWALGDQAGVMLGWSPAGAWQIITR